MSSKPTSIEINVVIFLAMDNSTVVENAAVLDYKLRFVELIVLGSMFVAALIGNALVLLAMLCKKHRHVSRMAFFILHLTIADLLVAFFSVLPMLIWKSTITFFGGDLLCRIVSFLMLTVSYISVYTLVVMAYDRYQAIVHPLSSFSWSNRTGLVHMSVVWCVSLLLASPQLIIFRVAYHPAYKQKTCLAQFLGTNRLWELVYIAWTIFMQFLLPICILIFCYSSVYTIVNRNISMYGSQENSKAINTTGMGSDGPSERSQDIPALLAEPMPTGQRHPNSPSVPCMKTAAAASKGLSRSPTQDVQDIMYPAVFRVRRSLLALAVNQSMTSIDGQKSQQRHGANHSLSRARLKTIKLTFIVVLTYVICSSPFYIGSIIMAVHGKFMSQKTMNWLMTIFSLLFNLNSCSNPIICLTLSGSLRRFQKQQSRRSPPGPKFPVNGSNKRRTSKIFVSL